jgi:hypothetical protein
MAPAAGKSCSVSRVPCPHRACVRACVRSLCAGSVSCYRCCSWGRLCGTWCFAWCPDCCPDWCPCVSLGVRTFPSARETHPPTSLSQGGRIGSLADLMFGDSTDFFVVTWFATSCRKIWKIQFEPFNVALTRGEGTQVFEVGCLCQGPHTRISTSSRTARL